MDLKINISLVKVSKKLPRLVPSVTIKIRRNHRGSTDRGDGPLDGHSNETVTENYLKEFRRDQCIGYQYSGWWGDGMVG